MLHRVSQVLARIVPSLVLCLNIWSLLFEFYLKLCVVFSWDSQFSLLGSEFYKIFQIYSYMLAVILVFKNRNGSVNNRIKMYKVHRRCQSQEMYFNKSFFFQCGRTRNTERCPTKRFIELHFPFNISLSLLSYFFLSTPDRPHSILGRWRLSFSFCFPPWRKYQNKI